MRAHLCGDLRQPKVGSTALSLEAWHIGLGLDELFIEVFGLLQEVAAQRFEAGRFELGIIADVGERAVDRVTSEREILFRASLPLRAHRRARHARGRPLASRARWPGRGLSR